MMSLDKLKYRFWIVDININLLHRPLVLFDICLAASISYSTLLFVGFVIGCIDYLNFILLFLY